MSGIFPPIYWTEFSWEAFAALFTGIAAVGGAIYIGKRQTKIAERQTELLAQQAVNDLKLRQQTLRMELLERRADCIQKMRRISAAWHTKAIVPDEQWQEFLALLQDAQLLYPDELVVEISKALDSSLRQKLHSSRATEYYDRGDQQRFDAQNAKSMTAEDELFEIMPGLLNKMIAHTRIFDWDDQGNGASRYDGASGSVQ